MYARHVLTNGAQVVCVQPEPELQLVGTRLLGRGAEEFRLGPRQGRVSISLAYRTVQSFTPQCSFVLQLISLAGLHLNATATAELAQRYQSDGMLAYVELVQRKEKELGCDVLTHQKWSGANYIDRILTTLSAGSSSTSSTGKDSTEHTF